MKAYQPEFLLVRKRISARFILRSALHSHVRPTEGVNATEDTGVWSGECQWGVTVRLRLLPRCGGRVLFSVPLT